MIASNVDNPVLCSYYLFSSAYIRTARYDVSYDVRYSVCNRCPSDRNQGVCSRGLIVICPRDSRRTKNFRGSPSQIEALLDSYVKLWIIETK